MGQVLFCHFKPVFEVRVKIRKKLPLLKLRNVAMESVRTILKGINHGDSNGALVRFWMCFEGLNCLEVALKEVGRNERKSSSF